MSVLRYSPPRVDASEFRREANFLIAPLVAALPARCVKCGEDCAGYQITRRYYRKVPWYARIFPLSLLYLLFNLLRSRIVLTIGLCPRHQTKRRRAMIVGTAIAIVGFAIMFIAVNEYLQRNDFGCAGIALIAGLIVGGGAAVIAVANFQVLWLHKADDQHAWYSGASAVFLRDIPAIK